MKPYQILIGKTVTIIDANNSSLVGMTGSVVDETKATFRLEVNKTIKQVLKRSVTMRILETGAVVQGSFLYGDIKSRIKRV